MGARAPRGSARESPSRSRTSTPRSNVPLEPRVRMTEVSVSGTYASPCLRNFEGGSEIASLKAHLKFPRGVARNLDSQRVLYVGVALLSFVGSGSGNEEHSRSAPTRRSDGYGRTRHRTSTVTDESTARALTPTTTNRRRATALRPADPRLHPDPFSSHRAFSVVLCALPTAS